MTMTMDERAAKLRAHIEDGTLLRHDWGDGYARACLLSALAPEVAGSRDPTDCPASVMPAWLVHLTPSMDDRGSAEAWGSMVRRYADLAGRWHVLDGEAWACAHRAALLAVLRVAHRYAEPHAPATEAVADVIAWVESGEPADDRKRVCLAASSAADAAVVAAGEAGPGSRSRLLFTAQRAARAAMIASHVRYDFTLRSVAVTLGSSKSVWDRVNDAILGAIEAQIEAANG